MSRDLIGPAFKLQHRVLIQKLREQEDTILGRSRERAQLGFSPTYLGRYHFPNKFPTDTRSSLLRRTQLLFCIAFIRTFYHCPPLSSLHPRRASAPHSQSAGNESQVSTVGLHSQASQSTGISDHWMSSSPPCRSVQNLT